MKRLTIWTENIRRSLAFPFPVKALGYLPDNIAHTKPVIHPTLNFCLLISGTPEQREGLCDQSRFAAHLPCLMVNIPGKTYANLKEGVADELYFAYDAAFVPAFYRIFPELETPIRDIILTPALSALVKHIHHLAENCHDVGAVDRLDICCYQLIVEMMLNACEQERPDTPAVLVRKIASYLESNFNEPLSWEVFLKAQSISYRSFIRHWHKLYSVSPTRFVNTLRIREAQRMLATTNLSVKEIARRIGVEDVYYFSRIFKNFAGLSPNAHRKNPLKACPGKFAPGPLNNHVVK